MIDIETEQLCLLAEATKCVPGNPHISTLIRWWKRGVKGVKLETLIVGGRRYTSVEAIQRFLAQLNEPGPDPNRSLSQRRKEDISRVEMELDAEGI
jgi:hypothetical protein